MQENAFKDAGVLGLSQHRGNCGRVVANVAVVTELERLASRAARDTESQRELAAKADDLARAAAESTRLHQRAVAALGTRRGRLDELIATGKTTGKTFARVALDHQQSLVHAENAAKVATKAQAALEKNATRRAEIERRQEAFVARKQHLGSQRTIRQLDVAQDMILTATKLTAAQLISFAMREYLPSMPMTATTFIRRIFTIHGRRETIPGEELIVLYENLRDPAVNDALQAAAGRLNSRALHRGGRALRFVVEPEPATDRRAG